jgi:hypothetical protein
MQEPGHMCPRDDDWSSVLIHGLLCILLHNKDCKVNCNVTNIEVAVYVILMSCLFRFIRLFIRVPFVMYAQKSN